jgi:hypothetical protein
MQVPENKARGDSTRREEDERAGGGKVIRDRMGSCRSGTRPPPPTRSSRMRESARFIERMGRLATAA